MSEEARKPKYFDHLRVRDELNGVTGEVERRAIVRRNVDDEADHFKNCNAGFDFDFDSPEALEAWAEVEETAEQLVRGESTTGHLSGALSCWKVGICERYIAAGRAKTEAARKEETTPAAAHEADEDTTTLEPPAHAAPRPKTGAKARTTSPRKDPPPKPPGATSQGSLFG